MTGLAALGNTGDGVQVANSDNNLIGNNNPVTGVTYYNAADVSPTPDPGWTGIRNADTAGNYLISGISGTEGILYDGTIAGVGATVTVNVPLAGVTASAVYGPDNLVLNQIALVGSYNTTGTGLADQYGFVFEGTTANLSNPADYTTVDAGGDFNIVHSTMGGLAVGNSDSSPSQGQGSLLAHAFLYDVGEKTFLTDIVYPGSLSDTAYGIWYNGGTSYTICGGWSPILSTISPTRIGPSAKRFWSITTPLPEPSPLDIVLLPVRDRFCHPLRGDQQRGEGSLHAKRRLGSKPASTNPIQGSWVTVLRNPDGSFGTAQWVNLNYTGIDPVVYHQYFQFQFRLWQPGGRRQCDRHLTFPFQATVNVGFQLSNVISGNGGNGIQITGANDNQIAMNYIGTDVTGTVDRGNDDNGILITADRRAI